jgi:cell division protein FtsB
MKGFINWCRRYVSLMFVAIVAFVLYVLFFNENSYGRLRELNGEIKRLKTEIQVNRDTMVYYHNLNRRLTTDPAEMERIVREQYHMQRQGEDVYIVE